MEAGVASASDLSAAEGAGWWWRKSIGRGWHTHDGYTMVPTICGPLSLQQVGADTGSGAAVGTGTCRGVLLGGCIATATTMEGHVATGCEGSKWGNEEWTAF